MQLKQTGTEWREEIFVPDFLSIQISGLQERKPRAARRCKIFRRLFVFIGYSHDQRPIDAPYPAGRLFHESTHAS